MRQAILGVFAGLLLAGVGVFWWQGRAAIETNAPPPPEPEPTLASDDLPQTDPGDMVGPAPPEASELTREETRFFRYDRNRDRIITRNEMLPTRTDAFRKLDKDGNNLLTFEEWAGSTAQRFDQADGNRDQELTPLEFASTRPKPQPQPARCRC